jgi:hypothetical protein
MQSGAWAVSAIENLPAPQMDELAAWLEARRVRRTLRHRLKAG